MNNSENTVFIEHCKNCKKHTWNTNHNQKKYEEFFTKCKSLKILFLSKNKYNIKIIIQS